MFMRSAHGRFLRVLSETVLTTLFLCQVIGAFCPVMPPTVEVTTAIQGVHAGHTMEMGRMCADSLPSSSKSFASPGTHSMPLVDALPPFPVVQHPAFGAQFADMCLAETGPPLYTRLSTFRI